LLCGALEEINMWDKRQLHQFKHEIEWLKNEILKLKISLPRKPSKQKQIDEYERQIKQKEYNIMFYENQDT